MLSTALWLWCPLQCFHRCPLSRGGCCSVFRFAKSVSQERAILFSSRLLSNLSAVNLRLLIMVVDALPEL